MKQENISLYYQDATSDKEYHLSLEAKNPYTSWTGWTVKARYGARGSSLTHVDRTRGSSTSYIEAKKLYDSIVKEKQGKGYETTAPGMSRLDRERITNAIESEGFDYAFTHYSSWNYVYNTEFHRLRKEYLAARNRLAKFLGATDEVSSLV